MAKTILTEVKGRNGYVYDAEHLGGEFYVVGKYVVHVVNEVVRDTMCEATQEQCDHYRTIRTHEATTEIRFPSYVASQGFKEYAEEAYGRSMVHVLHTEYDHDHSTVTVSHAKRLGSVLGKIAYEYYEGLSIKWD